MKILFFSAHLIFLINLFKLLTLPYLFTADWSCCPPNDPQGQVHSTGHPATKRLVIIKISPKRLIILKLALNLNLNLIDSLHQVFCFTVLLELERLCWLELVLPKQNQPSWSLLDHNWCRCSSEMVPNSSGMPSLLPRKKHLPSSLSMNWTPLARRGSTVKRQETGKFRGPCWSSSTSSTGFSRTTTSRFVEFMRRQEIFTFYPFCSHLTMFVFPGHCSHKQGWYPWSGSTEIRQVGQEDRIPSSKRGSQSEDHADPLEEDERQVSPYF